MQTSISEVELRMKYLPVLCQLSHEFKDRGGNTGVMVP